MRGTAGSLRAQRKTPKGFEAARLRQPGRAGHRSFTPARGGEASAHREALKPPPPPQKDLRAPERRKQRFRAKRGPAPTFSRGRAGVRAERPSEARPGPGPLYSATDVQEGAGGFTASRMTAVPYGWRAGCGVCRLGSVRVQITARAVQKRFELRLRWSTISSVIIVPEATLRPVSV